MEYSSLALKGCLSDQYGPWACLATCAGRQSGEMETSNLFTAATSGESDGDAASIKPDQIIFWNDPHGNPHSPGHRSIIFRYLRDEGINGGFLKGDYWRGVKEIPQIFRLSLRSQSLYHSWRYNLIVTFGLSYI